jgi:hypothetical protein
MEQSVVQWSSCLIILTNYSSTSGGSSWHLAVADSSISGPVTVTVASQPASQPAGQRACLVGDYLMSTASLMVENTRRVDGGGAGIPAFGQISEELG